MPIRPVVLLAGLAGLFGMVLSAAPLAAEGAPVATPGAASLAAAPQITQPYAAGELLVGFRPGTAARDRQLAREVGGAVTHEQLTPLATDVELWRLTAGRGVPEAIAAVSQNPNVRYAEPNYLVTSQATSDDPYFTNGSLWGMQGPNTSPKNSFGSNAAAAWAAGATGSRNIYVAVIDEGMQSSHPDLQANTWVNPYEIDGNGKDDDGNGYVDDIRGWDFYNNDNTTYDGTGDDHGTHVSGTIGGIGGNKSGVAGVNWAVTLISAKFLSGTGSIANAVRATDYVTNLKTLHPAMDIVATNNSWGGGGFSQTLLDAIRRGGAKNILFVAAAGNNNGSNNDTTPFYPAAYDCNGGVSSYDCLVAVASITSSGSLSSFSNYGPTTVELGAPGSGVWSTVPEGTYSSYSGTSMATPHVTGALALCASLSGNLRGANLRTALLSSTVSTPSLVDKTLSGGRLDVGAMIGKCGTTTAASAPTTTAISPDLGPVGTAVTISGTNLTGATVTFGGVSLATSNATSTSVTVTVPAGAVSGPFTVTTSGGTSTTPSFTVTSASATTPAAPTGVTASASTKGAATVRWTLGADGGSALTGQTVTVYLGNTNTVVGTVLVGATANTTKIRLTKGQTYSFTVSATNAVGTSAESSRSNTVTIT